MHELNNRILTNLTQSIQPAEQEQARANIGLNLAANTPLGSPSEPMYWDGSGFSKGGMILPAEHVSDTQASPSTLMLNAVTYLTGTSESFPEHESGDMRLAIKNGSASGFQSVLMLGKDLWHATCESSTSDWGDWCRFVTAKRYTLPSVYNISAWESAMHGISGDYSTQYAMEGVEIATVGSDDQVGALELKCIGPDGKASKSCTLVPPTLPTNEMIMLRLPETGGVLATKAECDSGLETLRTDLDGYVDSVFNTTIGSMTTRLIDATRTKMAIPTLGTFTYNDYVLRTSAGAALFLLRISFNNDGTGLTGSFVHCRAYSSNSQAPTEMHVSHRVQRSKLSGTSSLILYEAGPYTYTTFDSNTNHIGTLESNVDGMETYPGGHIIYDGDIVITYANGTQYGIKVAIDLYIDPDNRYDRYIESVSIDGYPVVVTAS